VAAGSGMIARLRDRSVTDTYRDECFVWHIHTYIYNIHLSTLTSMPTFRCRKSLAPPWRLRCLAHGPSAGLPYAKVSLYSNTTRSMLNNIQQGGNGSANILMPPSIFHNCKRNVVYTPPYPTIKSTACTQSQHKDMLTTIIINSRAKL